MAQVDESKQGKEVLESRLTVVCSISLKNDTMYTESTAFSAVQQGELHMEVTTQTSEVVKILLYFHLQARCASKTRGVMLCRRIDFYFQATQENSVHNANKQC